MGKQKEYILSLDISTSCIGVALFEDLGDKGELVILEHYAPKIKDKKIKGLEASMVKSDMFFQDVLAKYKNFNIVRIVIEEPLVRSNNANTVFTLCGFNMLLSKQCRDYLGVMPEYISVYNARANAWPELMGKKDVDSKGKKLTEAAFNKKEPTLFGAYPKDVDKKSVIWELVADKELKVSWHYNKKGELLKINHDMSDAYTVGWGQMKKLGIWK